MKDAFANPIQALLGKNPSKRSTESLAQVLLELVANPVIIVDVRTNRIMQSNRAFLALVGFTAYELRLQSAKALFEPFEFSTLITSEEIPMVLHTRSRSLIPVLGRSVPVNAADDKLLLEVIPVSEQVRTPRIWQDYLIRALIQVTKQDRNASVEESAQSIIDILYDVFTTSIIAIYWLSQSNAGLRKIASNERIDIIPTELPYQELAGYVQTDQWFPGKPIINTLHRFAIVNELTYIVSTPLNFGPEFMGILVIAGNAPELPDGIVQTLEAIAETYSTTLLSSIAIEDEPIKDVLSPLSFDAQKVLFDTVQEGVIALSPDLTVISINPSAELILGYTNEEVVGHPVENILISPDRVLTVLGSAVEGTSTPNLESITLHHRNGHTLQADVKIMAIEEDGKISTIIVLFNDISENVQMRIQTRQLEQRALLGEFMGVFAHEVLNPINSISTGAQLLKLRLGPEHPHYGILERMLADCERIDHQMEALKNYAKPYEPHFEQVEVQALLNRVLSRWNPRFARVKVKPSTHFPSEPQMIKGDWRALEDVFTNLVSNALDAMKETGGNLTIKVESEKDRVGKDTVVIRVSDDGPGIPDDIKERIFEPFVTTKSTGTGLGLAVTKRTITAHHGTIKVDSIPGGTVFTITMPAFKGFN